MNTEETIISTEDIQVISETQSSMGTLTMVHKPECCIVARIVNHGNSNIEQ